MTLLMASLALQASLVAAEADLVADGAKVEKLAGDFLFTEGPAADRQGNLYFSDIPRNRIHRYGTDGKLTTFRENSGGANGLYFDADGNLLACEGVARQLTSIAPDGKVTVLADKYDGKRFNSPNDLWIDPQGGVYFSDPRYGGMQGLEQDGFHVYYLAPDRKRLVRVTSDLVKPNGVLGTPDGKHLYVADAGAGKTYVYAIQPDGTLADKKLFASQGSDGMTRDEQGNVYLTSKEVTVYNPAGEKVASIAVPESPANVTFGGADHRTLFITARTSLYGVKMKVKGQ
jgi:gluconolactonase